MEKTVMFRTLEESDAESIYKWFNDDKITKMTVGLSKRISHEEAINWVKVRKNHNPYQAYWAICPINEPERIIGYASLTDIHYINSSANFSGILIGDENYHDGLAWIETYLFIYEYVFDRLNLNKLYGTAICEHKSSNLIAEATFQQREGVLRDAVYKNGNFYNLAYYGILRSEYYKHKELGDFDVKQIVKRIIKLKKVRDNY